MAERVTQKIDLPEQVIYECMAEELVKARGGSSKRTMQFMALLLERGTSDPIPSEEVDTGGARTKSLTEGFRHIFGRNMLLTKGRGPGKTGVFSLNPQAVAELHLDDVDFQRRVLQAAMKKVDPDASPEDFNIPELVICGTRLRVKELGLIENDPPARAEGAQEGDPLVAEHRARVAYHREVARIHAETADRLEAALAELQAALGDGAPTGEVSSSAAPPAGEDAPEKPRIKLSEKVIRRGYAKALLRSKTRTVAESQVIILSMLLKRSPRTQTAKIPVRQFQEAVMKLPALTDGVSRLRRSCARVQAALVRNLLVPAFLRSFV